MNYQAIATDDAQLKLLIINYLIIILATVNQWVTGSSPVRGASFIKPLPTKFNTSTTKRRSWFFRNFSYELSLLDIHNHLEDIPKEYTEELKKFLEKDERFLREIITEKRFHMEEGSSFQLTLGQDKEARTQWISGGKLVAKKDSLPKHLQILMQKKIAISQIHTELHNPRQSPLVKLFRVDYLLEHHRDDLLQQHGTFSRLGFWILPSSSAALATTLRDWLKPARKILDQRLCSRCETTSAN